jgi:penicillin-binding protein 1A
MSNGKTDIDYSPLALGGLTNGISVLDLAAAYVPFDNNGIYSKPRIYSQVLDSSGNVLLECKKESSVAMSEETAFIMNKLLQKVITQGTGTPAQLKGGAQPAAGKTGTTDDDTDRWFVGFTPYYVGAVWFGYDSPKTVSGVSVNPALALWKKQWKISMQTFLISLLPKLIIMS